MSTKRQYQTFIDEMIKHGDQVKAYKLAYPKASDESARVKSYTLLQNVTIASAIKEGADKIRAIATQEAITELKSEIKATVLTATEKRETLLKIVRGELETERIIFIPKEGFKKIKAFPDHADIMKAIEIDNKMSGDNAPELIKTESVLSVFVQPEDDGN